MPRREAAPGGFWLLKLPLYACCIGTLILATACYPPLPGSEGAAPSAPTPGANWTPPASTVREATESRLPADTLPDALRSQRDSLTPTDLVDLALDRNPETRASWLTARAAAATYGESLGELFPDVTGTVSITRLKTAATSGRVSVLQTVYGPSVSLSWLLFDFGGRGGAIDAARQQMYAANWSHNATLADVVRRTLQGYFAYVGARALFEAEQTSVQEAQVNLTAAQDRRAVGVATIADVLQARTALAQQQLAVQQDAGALASARGALATLIGLPPDASFDVDTADASAPVVQVAEQVDSLMAEGLLDRPDLAAERATVDQRYAEAREARSAYLPTLGATGTAGTVGIVGKPGNYPSYTLGLAVSVPIFDGFGWEYAARAAALTADAETARLRTMEQQVALQVYQTYQELRTATQSVATADDLLASASQSVDAARARYRQGVGSLIELLTAENSLADARAQRIQAHVNWHTSLVQLAHDAGLLQPSGATQLHVAPMTSPPAPGNPR